MSSDVTVTLAGFVGTAPKLFASANGNDYTSFRIANTKRYLDRTRGEWVDGRTIWFTVKCWRGTAKNVAESLRKGDPVVVTGRLAVDEWTSPEGPRTNLVIEASNLGPDLSRGQARFTPTVHRRDEPDDRTDGADAAVPDGAPSSDPATGEDPWLLTGSGTGGGLGDELDETDESPEHDSDAETFDDAEVEALLAPQGAR